MRTKREIFWQILYILFAKWLPLSYHSKFAKKSRAFYAKHISKNIGKEVNIEKGAVFSAQLSLGDYSGIGVNCEINGPVTIGKYVMMGPECVIYTQNHKIDDVSIPMQQAGFDEVEPVTIGDDVWIGRRVMIMPGVNIGKGVVIGAGSVVTKDIPDFCVVGGVPAKIIKERK